MPEPRVFCTFWLDRHCFAIDVLHVQEVIRSQPMTRVPLAPAVVRGLLNLRGEVVTAVDLRRRLDLPPAADGTEPMHVVVRGADGAVSLLVDRIGDVLELDPAVFGPPPETLSGPTRALVTGVCAHDDRLILALDVQAALDPAAARAA